MAPTDSESFVAASAGRSADQPSAVDRPVRPCRLLFVTGTPASVRGGSGTFVGISVLRQALEEEGIEVEMRAPASASPATVSRLLFNLGAAGAARGKQFDAIVGFDMDGLFVDAPGARRIASIKGVIADELRFERGATRLSLRIAAAFEKRHVQAADLVLSTSAYAASRIVEEYGVPGERIRVVPEPIALDRWESALAAARPQPRPGPVVLCVAHLYPRKQVGSLVRAMTLLRAPALLRIVGTGPELPKLEALARDLDVADRVTFLGHLPFAELAAEYRAADVFCLPSVQEGFGIVFLEAMAAGLPVVACQAAAIPEVVPDWECGVLVPPRDVPALAFALDRLLTDRSERRRLGSGGRRHVARYDAPRVARQFLDAITG